MEDRDPSSVCEIHFESNSSNSMAFRELGAKTKFDARHGGSGKKCLQLFGTVQSASPVKVEHFSVLISEWLKCSM